MNIKRVTIAGFKSYGESTTYEGFSNGLNAIIGFNGSGKSNFYKAIEFVLLDEYSKLTTTERRAILHEGVEKKAKKTTIEVVFNNQTRKIPINENEISIKRVVEEDKDELYINNKKKSRIDVHNLLESSGFNPSSGYYIVKQGKVNDLAIMQDKDRYDLICDIAGTKFYEQQREESIATIEKTKAQKSQIEESLKFIQQRIEQLGKEKLTLEKFEDLQNNRQAFEFLLEKQKSEKARSDIEAKEAEVSQLTAKLQEYKSICDDYEKKIHQKSLVLNEVANNLENANNERSNREYEKVSNAKILSREENNLYLIQKEAQQAEEASEKLKEMISNLDQQMATKKEEIGKLTNNLAEISTEISSIEALLDESSEFDIDKANKEIKNLEKSLSSYSTNDDFDDSALIEKCRAIEGKQTEIKEAEDKISSLSDELNLKNAEKENIIERLNSSNASLKSKQDKFRAFMQTLDSKIPFNILSGLSYIRSNNVEGVIGTLSDIIKVKSPEMPNIIELSLADHLFDIIVDTEQTADRIVDMIGANGNVTIISLDQVHCDHEIVNNSLLNFVECEDVYKDVIMLYLGSITLADEFSIDLLKSGHKAMTKNNVFIDENGVVTIPDETFVGTFSTIESINELTASIESDKSNHIIIEQEFDEIKSLISDLNTNVDDLKNSRNILISEMNSLETQKSEIQAQIANHEKHRMMISNIIENTNHRINELRTKIDVYSTKTKTLDTKSRNLHQKKLNNLKSQRNSLTDEKLKISHEIDYAIPQLKANYERDLSNIKATQINYKLSESQNDYKNALQSYENSDKKLQEINSKVSELMEEKSNIESDLSLIKLDLDSAKNNFDDVNKRISIIQDSIASLQKINNKHPNQISSQTLSKFSNKNEKQLRAEMKNTVKELSNLGYVNQRARTQYEEFSTQMQKLNKEIENLNDSEKSIYEIIAKLDDDKKSCLLKTFQSIKESFGNFYVKLTGGNQADLVLDEGNRTVSIWLPSKMTIGQLSGGQKSVVALSLVFAIQHVNPAPFYLMDEVDAALDPQHRARLSELIKSQSIESQYIVTTFKDELVHQSDAAFYLKFEKGMTFPQVVEKEEALRIISTQ